jgi:F-type H+-transporting ATPase subunit b
MKRSLAQSGKRSASYAGALVSLALLILIVSAAAKPATAHTTLALFQDSNGSGNQISPGQQLVQETREAAGEDKGTFKHSLSVQWISQHTGLSVESADWLSELINFGAIALGIIWLSKKYLPHVFRQRNASIQKAIEDARKASEDANRRLADIESRLSKLDLEIGNMRTTAEKEAEAEEQRIKAAAAEDARKIVESVEQEVAALAKNARRELTAYAANLAVSLAKKQIQVDTGTDQALIRGFAQQLSGNGDERRKQ